MACLLLSSNVLPLHAMEMPVPADFVGDWVPQKLSCQSPVRLRIEPSSVSFVNGRDMQRFTNLDLCHTCEGGAQYRGDVVWLTPDSESDKAVPFTVRFNNNEQHGITVVEIEQATLKKRFPLHNVMLRKCAH